jgi:protein SCO1
MPRIRILALFAFLALATASMAAYALTRTAPPPFHGTDLGPGITAPAFTLEAADRGAVSLSDFEGRAVLMFFGYTQCPDVCPVSLAKLRLAMEQLGDRRRDVQVLLITVDPEMDSPHRMREYLQHFDLAFVGLSGEREELERVAAAYGVYMGELQEPEPVDAAVDPHAGHGGHGAHRLPPRIIDHTSHVFGIDRRGNFRLLWGSDATADQIAEDVRRLIRL